MHLLEFRTHSNMCICVNDKYTRMGYWVNIKSNLNSIPHTPHKLRDGNTCGIKAIVMAAICLFVCMTQLRTVFCVQVMSTPSVTWMFVCSLCMPTDFDVELWSVWQFLLSVSSSFPARSAKHHISIFMFDVEYYLFPYFLLPLPTLGSVMENITSIACYYQYRRRIKLGVK